MGELRFILGRAGSGKTSACLDLATAELKKSPLIGPAIILLSPEQATFQMSRMLAGWQNLNGYIRGRVLSFKKLAQLVVTEASGNKRPMLGFSRKLIMQQLLTKTGPELKFWTKTPPEKLADSLLTLIDELNQARLSSKELADIYEKLDDENNEDLKNKLSDMIILSQAQEQINLPDFNDPSNFLSEYRELVGQIDWLKNASVYVDGFSGFTGQEYAALLATIEVAKETFVTLSVNPNILEQPPSANDQQTFWPGEQTLLRLKKLAKSANITIGEPINLTSESQTRFSSNKTLNTLENFLGGNEVKDKTADSANPVISVSAENPAHEVELAAGKILQLVRDRNMQFRDISIILRETQGYEHLLRYTFDQYKIPYFLDIRRPIGQHPLTRLILSAANAVAGDFESEWILRSLKTGLTNCPNERSDRIENYVQANGIKNDKWRTNWKYKLELIGIGEDEIKSDGENFDLKILNQFRKELIKPLESLEKFWGKTQDAQQEFSIDVLLDGLMEFLQNLDVATKLSKLSELENDSEQDGQIHQQILNVVTELFSQLKLTLTGEMLSLTNFVEILSNSFAELSIGVIPANIDQVLIGTIERSRHPNVKASLILGFNEGNWPSPLQEDVMLSDQERRTLAWEDLTLKGDIDEHFLKEQYLMYTAMTRPSEFLWISHSKSDSNGNERSPSRYLRQIEHFLNERNCLEKHVANSRESIQFWNPQTPIPFTHQRLISEVVSAIGLADSENKNAEQSFWFAMANSLRKREDSRNTIDRYIAGRCDSNSPQLEPHLARQLFGRQLSFSQLETFYKCPFQHFCKYGLKLRALPKFQLDPMDMGMFRHEVMKFAWMAAASDDANWHQLATANVESIVAKAVQTAAKEVKGEILFENARNRYILFQTQRELTLSMSEQLRMLGPCGFTPGEFEKDFSFEIISDDERYELIGRIDRIDFAPGQNGEWILIIDYKSGSLRFKLNELMSGTQLQLPGYLMVAMSEGENRFAAGGLLLSLKIQDAKGNDETAMISNFSAKGMINEEALAIMKNPQSQLYPYGLTIKKDGNLKKNSMVMEWLAIENILNKTYTMTTDAISHMANGKIEIQPYFDGNNSVCPMCDMRGVCRFTHGKNRYRGVASTADAMSDEL